MRAHEDRFPSGTGSTPTRMIRRSTGITRGGALLRSFARRLMDRPWAKSRWKSPRRSGSSAASSTSPWNCVRHHARTGAPQRSRDHLGRSRATRTDSGTSSPRSARSPTSPVGVKPRASRCLPLIPGLAIACAHRATSRRTHINAVFSGFSASRSTDRIATPQAVFARP